MPDSVRLRKASGGAPVIYEGQPYHWGEPGDVVEVPYAFAVTLLGIPGGGYSDAGDPASEPQGAADEPPDLARRPASPVTPRPRAGTSRQSQQGQRAASGRRASQQ